MQIFGEEVVDGGSFLWVAMGADVASGFVDHPEFGEGFCELEAEGGEGFEVGFGWDKHVFVDAFAVDADEAQFDELLGLPARADCFEAEPAREADGAVLGLVVDDFAESCCVSEEGSHIIIVIVGGLCVFEEGCLFCVIFVVLLFCCLDLVYALY